MSQISGIVEQVGTKFNGSVKLGGKFYNFKKGTDYSGLKPGDNVTLELSPWEFNGKSGENVTGFSVKEKVAVASKAEAPAPRQVAATGRDFDKEARGKTRCSLFAAAIQSPALAGLAGSKNELAAMAIELADKGVAYTFDD